MRAEGLALADEYVKSHAFLHDDTWLDLEGDRDEVSGHPLLLPEAPLVLTSKAAPVFPDRGGKISPAVVRMPPDARSPLAQLSESEEEIDRLAAALAMNRLDISAFYADRVELEEIRKAVERRGGKCAIHPSPEHYRRHEDHRFNLGALAAAADCWPRTRVCWSADQVADAFDDFGPAVFCKKRDSRTARVTTRGQLELYSATEGYPLVVQEGVAARSSPVFHWITFNGVRRPLFVLRQILHQAHHAGNVYEPEYEKHIVSRFADVMRRCLELLPLDWVGFAGVDLIETANGADLIPIDLNARFNSSTIPFLSVLGPNRGRVRAGHGAVVYLRHETSFRPAHLKAMAETVSPVVAESTTWFGESPGQREQVIFSLTESADSPSSVVRSMRGIVAAAGCHQ
ncbi:hypothetical protein [Micromonospora sp. WMMB235]|uniref:hypothetical protein n=1 Tax=Micromonospora sp. WMMB235 TaxID=1172030 RepID=UPI0015A1E23C|nr:hypothetical protein [Micromonospora sp. WMMB235]